MTKTEIKYIKISQANKRAVKETGKKVSCPFIGIGCLHSCKLCHKFMGTKSGRYLSHPCNQLSDDEVKKRYWRNID